MRAAPAGGSGRLRLLFDGAYSAGAGAGHRGMCSGQVYGNGVGRWRDRPGDEHSAAKTNSRTTGVAEPAAGSGDPQLLRQKEGSGGTGVRRFKAATGNGSV